ncbi:hypothetical protein [Paraburkholderia caballeronis]|uniref:hypothetical protein n=1 Tax=Paraburkholderia caballeronis TaxID=416943 RepID=UPI001FCB7464|nr:hypothetical protein [Paraburkholderia caballeronis]
MNTRPAQSGTEKQSLLGRLKGINKLFAATVLAPTLLATVYFTLFASDIYVSESRFVVRSPQRQNQTSIVGALLQGTGFTRAQDDTYPVIDYIESRDALDELNRDDAIVKTYLRHGDLLGRYASMGFRHSFEALLKYYQSRIVSIDLDTTSSIATLQVRAFSARQAAQINEQLLDMSERLVNRMNDRAANDTVRFAQQQVDIASAKAREAVAAVAYYRNANSVFDPDRQSALQLEQTTALQAQLLAARTRLAQLESIAPNNPQINALKIEITGLEGQIHANTGRVMGGKDSFAAKAAQYERLQVDAQFADKQLTESMALLETSRAEAARKQLYLERLVQPNTPDEATEPHRLKSVFVVFILGMIIWGVSSLLIAGMREHRD